MCDYSIHNVRSRPARIGDKLTTRDFGTGTHRKTQTWRSAFCQGRGFK